MRERTRATWSRRYPPLTGAFVAALLAVFVLPSALNVPQSNPSQTLEFAPVPPEDEEPPPPESGNIESVGLGTSSTAPGAAGGGDGQGGLPPVPPPIPEGVGDRPVTKRCVGNPPRQTEDPLSPPCVAHFEGDNGGATYHGVTREQITIVIYLDGTTAVGPESDANEASSDGTCHDLSHAPGSGETITPKYMRVFQRYFNDRYQTYNRFTRFVVCFSTAVAAGSAERTPETRTADAVHVFDTYRPFAVIMSQIRYGLDDVFAEVLAQRGVLSFGSASGSRSAEFYRRFPGLMWSYLPSIEEQARLFSSYVCQKVVPHPVVDSGHEQWNGGPRSLGWLQTSDDSKPHLLRFADVARAQIEACGGVFAADGTFPDAGQVNQSQGDDPAASYATANMATFQQAEVTTIVWPGGYETDHGKAATSIGYSPEVVVAGDGLLDGNSGGFYQDQDFWAHAWTATQQVRLGERDTDPCRRAIQEAYPEAGTDDMNRVCSFPYYRDLRQLFTGVQVAGPRLTVDSLDRGFHAIPGVPSDDPEVAACFYNPGDYTCVKDATSQYWDPDATAPSATVPGCWRMVEGGRRYVAGGWDDGNIDARARPEDPCNRYTATPLVF